MDVAEEEDKDEAPNIFVNCVRHQDIQFLDAGTGLTKTSQAIIKIRTPLLFIHLLKLLLILNGWLLDSGSTNHVTADQSNIHQKSEYEGFEKLTIRNGQGLPITHTGSSYINSPQKRVLLRDILHVPEIKKKSFEYFSFNQL